MTNRNNYSQKKRCQSRKYKRGSIHNWQLYRVPEEAVFSGVCSGIAHYFGLSPTFVRCVVVIISLMGFFWLSIGAYIFLSFTLPCAEPIEADRNSRYVAGSNRQIKNELTELEKDLAANMKELEKIERYVTSESFQIDSRIRRL